MQIWPWCRNEPHAPADAAPGTSASSSTISAELPPSSRCTRLRCWPASAPTCRPTAVDPVNEMIRTTGSVISASPASGPPGSTCSTPLGQAGLLEHPGQHHPAAHRGPRVRLQHHRVAQGQRGRHRADGQDLREVERRDHPDHPGGYPLGPAQVGRLGGQQLTVGPGRQGGRLVDLLGGHMRLELRGRADLPAFPDAPLLDLSRVRPPDVSGPAQDGRPLGVRHRGPPGLGRRGGRRGRRDVGRRADAGPAQLLAGGGLGDRRLAAGRGCPAAAENLAAPRRLIEKCHGMLLDRRARGRRTTLFA